MRPWKRRDLPPANLWMALIYLDVVSDSYMYHDDAVINMGAIGSVG